MAFTEETIRNRFTYHKPDGEKPVTYQLIRGTALDFALLINRLCPDCRELAIALTKLEEVVMWANAGIARNPEINKSSENKFTIG
jgi:hypothetical protein